MGSARRFFAAPMPALIVLLALAAPVGPLAAELPWETPLLGAGAIYRAVYDGSEEMAVSPIPAIGYYPGPFLLRTTMGVLEGGARITAGAGFTAGPVVVYEEGRAATDVTRDAGFGAVGAGVSLGILLEQQGWLGPAPYHLLLRIRRPLAGSRGVEADGRGAIGIYGGSRLGAALYAETTWADARSARTLYGADSGLLHLTAGLLWSFALDGDWVLLGSAGDRALLGDARNSALAGRPHAPRLTLSLAYRL